MKSKRSLGLVILVECLLCIVGCSSTVKVPKWNSVDAGTADAGLAAERAGVFVWSWSGEDVPGAVMTWDQDSETAATTLAETPELASDGEFFFSGDRVYWLRQHFDGQSSRPVMSQILSMDTGESTPTIELQAGPIESFAGAEGVVVWSERAAEGPSQRVAIMRLPERQITVLTTTPTGVAEVVASDVAVAWVSRHGERTIHVMRLSENEQSGFEMELENSATTKATYIPGSLAISGSRLAWEALLNGQRWIRTCRIAAEADVQTIGRSDSLPYVDVTTKLEADADHECSVDDDWAAPVEVSEDAVAWVSRTGGEELTQTSEVCVWDAQGEELARIARYEAGYLDPERVAVGSSGRVAWVVDDGESRSVEYWTIGDERATHIKLPEGTEDVYGESLQFVRSGLMVVTDTHGMRRLLLTEKGR